MTKKKYRIAAFAAMLPSVLLAQTTPAGSDTSPASAKTSDEEIIVLSPF